MTWSRHLLFLFVCCAVFATFAGCGSSSPEPPPLSSSDSPPEESDEAPVEPAPKKKEATATKPAAAKTQKSTAPAQVPRTAISPDAHWLATINPDGTIRFFDVTLGQLKRSLSSPFQGVTALTIDQAGHGILLGTSQGQLHQLVTSSVDGLDQIQQRDELQKSVRPIHAGHTGDILAVEYSDNERLIGTLGKDGTVRLWLRDVGSPKSAEPLDLAKNTRCLALRPNGGSLLIGTDAGITELALDGLKVLREAPVDGGVTDISTLSDGRVVVCTGRNRPLILNADLSRPEGESRPGEAAGDGKVIAVRGSDSGYWTVQTDGLIREVAIATGQEARTLSDSPLASIYPIGGQAWVGQLRDGPVVRIPRLGEAADKLPLAPTLQKPTALAVSANGSFAVAGDSQGVANLIDLGDQSLAGQITVVPGRRLEELAVTADGRFLAAAADRKIFLTEWKGGGTTLPPPEPGARIVATDGSRIVAVIASRRNEVSFVDLDRLENEPVKYEVPDSRVTLVVPASGNRWLVARENGQIDRLAPNSAKVDASLMATANRPVALHDAGEELIVADSTGSTRIIRWTEPVAGRKRSLARAGERLKGSPQLSLTGEFALAPSGDKLVLQTTSEPSDTAATLPTEPGRTVTALDPEGRSVAWLDKSGTAQVRLIDPTARTVTSEFAVTGSAPWERLATGDQGRLLATAAKDGVVNVWRTKAAATAVGWPMPADIVAVDRSPDGLRTLVVTASGLVQAGELSADRPTFSKTFGPCSACWSRDGKGIVVASRTAVEYFNAVSAAPDGAVRIAILDPKWVRSSGTGRRFWVGATDGSIRQVDLTSKQVLKDWPAIRGDIRRFDATTNRLLILTGTEALVREVEGDGKDLRLAVGDVADAAFSSDGSLLATLASTGKLQIWQILKKAVWKELDTGIASSVALGRSSANGWWTILGQTGDVALVDWQGQLLDRAPPGSLANLRASAPFADEGLLVATQQSLLLIQPRLHSLARVSARPISTLGFAGTRYLAAADVDRDLWLWNLDDRALVRAVRKLPAEIKQIIPLGTAAFGVLLADGSARIVSINTARKIISCDVGDDIIAVGTDPAGQMLACATASGTIRLFETAAGQLVEEIAGQRLTGLSTPSAIGVAADRGRLTICDEAGDIVELPLRTRLIATSADPVTGFATGGSTGPSAPLFWTNSRGQLLRFPGKNSQAELVTLPVEKVLALRRDAEVLLATDKERSVALIEIATGKVLFRRDMPAVRSAKFSERGDHIACELDAGVIEVISGQSLQTVRRHVPSKAPVSYGVVDDPAALITTLPDGTIELIDFRDTESSLSRQWDIGATALAFSADGGRLLAALADQSVVAWDVASGDEKSRWQVRAAQSVERLLPTRTGLLALAGRQLFQWKTLAEPDPAVIRLSSAATWMALSPDESRLLVGGTSSQVEVIDLAVGNVIADVTLSDRDLLAGRWRDGNAFSVITKSGQMFDESVPVRAVFNSGLTNVTHADIALTARIAAAANDRKLAWFSTSGKSLGQAETGTGRLVKLAISPDGRYLSLLMRDSDGATGRLKLVNTADGDEVCEIALPAAPVDFRFRDDGLHGLVGLEDGRIAVVEFLAARINELLSATTDAVRPALASEREILWVSASGKVGQSSLTTAGVVDCDGGQPRSLDFCLNDTAVLVGLADGRVVVWSVANQKRITTVKLHAGPVDVVRVHKTSPLVATADASGELRVWALEQLFSGSGELQPSIVCNHRAPIRDAWLDPDAPRALSCGTDGAIKVWDLAEGKETRRLGGTTTKIVKFAPGPVPGQTITVGEDSFARVWDYVAQPDGKSEAAAVREIAIHASREDLLARMSAGKDGAIPPELQSQLDLLKQEQAAPPPALPAQRDNAVASALLARMPQSASVDPGITLRRQKLEGELRAAVSNDRKQEVRQELVRLKKEEELTVEVSRAKSDTDKVKAKKSLEEFKKAERTSDEAVRRALGESPAEQSVKARLDGNAALLATLRPKLWPTLEYDPETARPTHLVAELRSQFQYGVKERPRVVLNVTDDAVFAAAGREAFEITLAEGGRKVLPPLIQAWDVPTKTVLRSWTELEGISLRNLSLSSSQDVIYSAPDVRMFDLVSGSQRPLMPGSAVAMSPSNHILAVGARGRALETVDVLKLVSGPRLEDAVTARSDYEGWALALAWCLEGETLVASFRDRLRNRLLLLDPKKPGAPYVIEELAFEIPWTKGGADDGLGYECIIPAPRNEYLVVTGRTGATDYGWKVYRLSEMAKMKSPSEKPLMQTTRLRPFVDIERSRPAFFIAGLTGKRQTLIVDQGTSIAAVRMSDQAFAELDLQKIIGGQFVTTFSADGRWLAIGDDAGRVFVLDVVKLLAGDSSLPSFQGHSAPIVGLSFSPSSNVLVTTAEDNSVRIWSLSGIDVESPQALLDRLEQEAKKGPKRPGPRKPAAPGAPPS